jgi:hypothetical protein
MFLSTESVHSAYIYSIITARLERIGFSSVLVLVRAWAIWGTRKRVTNILTWSYVGYVMMLLAGSAHTLQLGNSGSHLFVFILICKNSCALVVQYQFINVIHVCVTTMPSK